MRFLNREVFELFRHLFPLSSLFFHLFSSLSYATSLYIIELKVKEMADVRAVCLHRHFHSKDEKEDG